MNICNSIMMTEQLALKPTTVMAQKWSLPKQIFMRLRQMFIQTKEV